MVKEEDWNDLEEKKENSTLKPKKQRGGNTRKLADPQTAYPLINDLNQIRMVLMASSRGDGLCVNLSKEMCDLFMIKAGDVLITTFGKHYRKNPKQES